MTFMVTPRLGTTKWDPNLNPENTSWISVLNNNLIRIYIVMLREESAIFQCMIEDTFTSKTMSMWEYNFNFE